MVIHREYSPQTSDKPKSSVSPSPGSAADDRTPGDVLIGWNEGGRRGVGRRHPRDRDVSGVVDGEARSELGVHPRCSGSQALQSSSRRLRRSHFMFMPRSR
jgi:hypothetical protein